MVCGNRKIEKQRLGTCKTEKTQVKQLQQHGDPMPGDLGEASVGDFFLEGGSTLHGLEDLSSPTRD